MNFTSNKSYLIRGLYDWILDNNGTPYIVVSAEYPSVMVPNEHVKDGEIVLNISPSAAHGIELGHDFIEFNARFSGVARQISVPVAAVAAIYARENGQGMGFTVEWPKEDANESASAESESKIEAKPTKAKPSSKKGEKKSHLKIIK